MAPASSYVVQLDGRLAFVDKGRSDGFYEDQYLQLVRHESIIHPVTGEDLGGDVPLGSARVVEVFEKLATAEIIELALGMDLETLGMEVGAGKIRVRELSSELAEGLRSRVQKTKSSAGKMVTVGGMNNPVGPIRGLIPDLDLQFGGRVETAFPDRAYKLIPNTSLALADTTLNDSLANFNGSRQLALALEMPMTTKLSARAEFAVGSESQLAIGGAFHPGPIFNFVGDGYNPDGEAGAPGFTLVFGSGGRGARSLPLTVSNQIFSDSLAVAAQVLLDDPAATDSTIAVEVLQATSALRQSAEDSLDTISKRGFGFRFGVTLPASDRLTLRAALSSFGSLSEFTLGTTFFMKPYRPNMMNANPDGVTRSLVFGSDLIYDLKISQIYIKLNFKVPLTRRFTLTGGLLSDLAGISRYGLSFKTYLKN